MGKKKKGNIFLKILGCLFVLFIALFIANMSGYYEGKIREEVSVTEEGENIDITSFLNNSKVDYSSKMSNLGDNLTYGLENFVSKGMGFVVDILKSLF